MTKNIEQFLDEYLSEQGLNRRHKNVRYIQFVETAQDIDEHLTNLLSGKVSAGFRIKKWYLEQAYKWGEPDHIIIMTDFYGMAKAAAKITYCETILYKNMTEKLALAIGYGDGSLNTWKQKSHAVINTDCIATDVKFNGDVELLITHFEMLYY